jgi:hypothetical protein
MKLQVLQENLSKTLAICSRFASSKVQLPVLANILFKTTKNKLVLATTNLETSVSVSIGAKLRQRKLLLLQNCFRNNTNLNPGQVGLEEEEILKINSSGFESSISIILRIFTHSSSNRGESIQVPIVISEAVDVPFCSFS